MAETEREKALQIIAAYFDGVYQGGVEDIPLHPDVVFYDPIGQNKIQGEHEVRNFLSDVSAAFGQTDVKYVRDIIDGNFVSSEVRLTLDNGNQIDLCDVFEIRENKLISIRPYFDPRPMLG